MAVQMLGIKTKFTDDQGRPLIGGSVHTYYAGTSLPQDTFSDPELTVPNTNPVKLDDTGSANIFLKGTYRVRVFDKNGVFVEEQDNVDQLATVAEVFENKGGLNAANERIDALTSEVNSVKEKTIIIESIADLSTINNPKDGLRVYVKSYYPGLGKGGGYFTYDSSKSSVNDGGTVVNGWVRSFPVSNEASIDDFGGDIVAAGKWVKSSVKNFCKLNANEVYEISETGLVYLNRMICEDGRARIVVSAGSELTYEDVGVGDFVLRNIELIVLGKRVGQSSTSTGYVFKATTTAVNTVDIYGVTAYGLTDASDINSWSDDLGKTRAPILFRALVNTHSNIENLTTYGLAGGVVVTPNTLSATHREKNIKGYNCETLVYLPRETWASGESKDLSIYNTEAQALYWRGQSVGQAENGLDTLMCEANHTHEYKVDNVFGENVIERSVYMQSNIVTISNIEDLGSSTMIGAKMGLSSILPDSKAIMRSIRGRNLSTNSSCQQIYGYSVYDIKDVNISNDVYTAYHRGITFSDTNSLTMQDGYFKNIGLPFYLSGSNKIDEITISDFKLVNCGALNQSNLWLRRVDAGVGILRFKNIEFFWDDLVLAGGSIASNGSFFHDIDKLYMDNVELYATSTPFTTSNVGYTEITNCNFTMIRANTVSVMWGTLDTASGNTGLRANVFDFAVRIIPTTANKDLLGTAEVKFKKTKDTGVVNCKDYWREFSYNHPCKELFNAPIAAILNKPFECLVSLGSSQLKMTYDPTTNALTEIYNIGDALSSVETVGKISVSVIGANLHIRVQDGAWIGTSETVSVVCTR